MSSFKLNDPLAPTYRRNYRTHLALEANENCCNNPSDRCSERANNCTRRGSEQATVLGSPVGNDRGSLSPTVDTLEDEALLLPGSSECGTTTTSQPRDNVVEDSDGFVRMAFFLFGLVSLLPWNFFITASEYWMYKFRDVSARGNGGGGMLHDPGPEGNELVAPQTKTPLQSEFFSALSIASNIPYLLMIYLAALLNEKVSARVRNPAALLCTTILFASVTALVTIDTDQWQKWFYRLTLVQMLLIGGSAAFFQSGIMGVASMFPSEYSHACMVGQSAGGVVASVFQIAVLLLNVSAVTSGLVYFLIALVVLFFSVFVLFRTQQSAFYRYYVRRYSSPPDRASIQQQAVTTNTGLDHDDDDDYHGDGCVYENNFEVKVRTGLVVRKLWHYCVALVLIYVVTMGAFPGVLVHVETSDPTNTLWKRLFSPVACFLVFNVGDLLGRLMASSSWSAFPVRRENLLVALTLMRALFLPLLFACNVQPRAEPSMTLQVLLHSDLAFVTVNALFAVSNGYLTSVAMVQGPKKLESFLQEKAGAVLVAMLATGMATGSVASLFFVRAFFHPPAALH